MAAEVPAPEAFASPILYVGRYALFDEIASGGFASVHLGRAIGVGGFARTVAIKRLHRQYAKDPEVSAMFLDEAKVVARIRHPNVLPTLDLISEDEELFLVMEYVEGVTLRYLMRQARKRKRQMPLGVTLRIIVGALHGLHAAHEAHDEQGEPLHVIHRDVSPDNILVGTDGMPRLLDFGVARAMGQFHSTRDGEVKGKLAYITPEQVRGEALTRRADIFSASVVLWEAMTGTRLFGANSIAAIAHNLLTQRIPPPSEVADTPKKLDGMVLQGLDRDPDRRWSTAERMASALEAVGELASQAAVARYVRQAGADRIGRRAAEVKKTEAASLDKTRFARQSQAEINVNSIDIERAKALRRALAKEKDLSVEELPLLDAADVVSDPGGMKGPDSEAPDAETGRPSMRTPDGLTAPDLAPAHSYRRHLVPFALGAALAFGVALVVSVSGDDEPPEPAAPNSDSAPEAAPTSVAVEPVTPAVTVAEVDSEDEAPEPAPATSASSKTPSATGVAPKSVAPVPKATASAKSKTGKVPLYGRK